MPEATKKMEESQTELDLESAVSESNSVGAVITLDHEGKEIKGDSAKSATTETGPTPEQTIEELKKQVEEAKTRETAAQERISRLEAEHQSQVKKVTNAIDNEFKARETSVENAINASKNELDSVRRQLREAREKGDIDKEIELEEKLADARYQYNASMWEKNNLAAQKKVAEDTAKNATINNQNPDGSRKFSDREMRWISEHPRYNTDDDYQAFVWSLDAQAKKKGIIPDTDAYYEFLNTRLDKVFGERQQMQDLTPPPAPKQATTVAVSTAAPVGRGGNNSSNPSNVTQIRLTAEQLEAAEISGMTPVEYAQDLINQQREKAGR